MINGILSLTKRYPHLTASEVCYGRAMSEKNSLANKKRWAKVPKTLRSKKMREIVLIKHKKSTPEEKRAHALKMVKARDGH